MSVNTSEKGLEDIIVDYLRDVNGYNHGGSSEYDRTFALLPDRVEAFIKSTQPDKAEELHIFTVESERKKFSPGFVTKSPSAALPMCCAVASAILRALSTSTIRCRANSTRRPNCYMRPTISPLSANCIIQQPTLGSHSM